MKTRLDRIKTAIEKGYTCDIETGKVYGVRGKEITRRHESGYIMIGMKEDNIQYNLLAHQYIWYIANKEVVELIDHINEDKSDNRLSNLRKASASENSQNRKMTKGYGFVRNRWRARIKINKKDIILGYFDTEDEARQAYLDAKKIYHTV